MEGLFCANVAAVFAIIIILFLRKMFINKVFSKFFVLLWLIVILRLLVPFEFSSALSIYEMPEKVPSVMTETEDAPPYEIPVFIYEESPEEGIFAEIPAQKEKAEISNKDILFAVWISGAAFFGGIFAARHFYAVKKLLENSERFYFLPEDFEGENTRFYKSKSISSPLSFGLLRPTVIIPENIREEQLPFVLLHEQTHIRNRDAALKTAAVAALIINWFDPFVWIMVKYFERDLERLCDERVLSSLGGEKASLYANTILDFAESESLSMSFFSAASLRERVISIMKNKTKQKHVPAFLCVFAAIIFVMTACGTTPREPEKLVVNVSDMNAVIEEAIEAEQNPQVLLDIESGETEEEEPTGTFEYTVPGDFNGYRVDFTWPCEETVVTCGLWGYKDHTGIDIGENKGSEIYAAAGGTVTTVKRVDTAYGWHAIIDHGNSVSTLYAHCSEIYVHEGQKVEKGELIALTGSSGNSTGTHLHFELRYGELYLDPLKHIPTPEQENYMSSQFRGEAEESGYIRPVLGNITAVFEAGRHLGVDYYGELGSNICAVSGGTVVKAARDETDYGNHIIIDHGNGIQTLYAHCEELFVEPGQEVSAGEVIASIGASGNSTGPHLHFEFRINGEYVDPMGYIG